MSDVAVSWYEQADDVPKLPSRVTVDGIPMLAQRWALHIHTKRRGDQFVTVYEFEVNGSPFLSTTKPPSSLAIAEDRRHVLTWQDVELVEHDNGSK